MPPIDPLFGHVSSIRSLAASSSRIASVGYDNAIKVWDTKKSLVSTYAQFGEEEIALTALAYDPRERILASANQAGTIKFWDPASGQEIGSVKSSGQPISCLAFSPKDNPLLLVAGVGNDAQVWEVTLDKDAVTAKPTVALKKHTAAITCLSIAGDGKSLATGGLDSAVNIWSLPDGKEIRRIETPTPITAVYYDENLAISGDAQGVAALWNTEKGKLIFPPYKAHGAAIHSVMILKQKKQRGVASAGADQAFRLWAAIGETQRFETLETYRGHNRPITCLVQGKGFFATGGLDGTVKTWDYSLPDERFTFNVAASPIRALALANERAILAIGDDKGMLKFIRSQPRPSYGPALEAPEPKGGGGDE